MQCLTFFSKLIALFDQRLLNIESDTSMISQLFNIAKHVARQSNFFIINYSKSIHFRSRNNP